MIKQPKAVKETQSKIGKILSTVPITPNQWTLISLILAAIGGYQIVQNNLILGLMLFAVSALCDAIDGAVARARNEVSNKGAFLDGVVDRFVEAIFLFSFMFYPLPTIFIDSKIWISLLIFLGSCMPSFIKAYADHREAISKEKASSMGGICERSERLLIILFGLGSSIYIANMNYFVYSIILATGLSCITIIQRIKWSLEE